MSTPTAIAALTASGILVAGSIVGANAVGATPHHAPAAKAASESFLISYGPHEKEVVVAHGLFTGGGKDIAGNNHDTMHLGGGTLRINHPESKSHYHQKLNPKTCYASFTIKGSYTLNHGTGNYAGYTGSGTYKVTGEAIAKQKASGACNENADPKVEAAYIHASGTASKK
jgi:hypothetical protein